MKIINPAMIDLQWFGLDKEFITGTFEGATDEQVEKILKEVAADTTGLKVNSEKMKAEIKAAKDELEKLKSEGTASAAAHEEQVKKLEEQLKATDADGLKAFHEAELKKVNEAHTVKLADAEKARAEIESKSKILTDRYNNLWRATELEKAMNKVTNIDPEKRAMLQDLFWTRHQFNPTTLDNEEKLLNKDYKSIQDVLLAYTATDEGKFFLVNKSTGGGAKGGAASKGASGNPWAKDTLNLTEQARIFKENPILAATLKAQAGK